MATHFQDLSGHTVYIRLPGPSASPLPETFDGLVGEGKLVSNPNDVIVGPGSRWFHERDVRNVFATFGNTHTTQRYGRTTRAKCTLMLHPVWWWEYRDALSNSNYAEIAYLVTDETVCAGIFLFARKFSLPSLDFTQFLRHEFVGASRIVLAHRD